MVQLRDWSVCRWMRGLEKWRGIVRRSHLLLSILLWMVVVHLLTVGMGRMGLLAGLLCLGLDLRLGRSRGLDIPVVVDGSWLLVFISWHQLSLVLVLLSL